MKNNIKLITEMVIDGAKILATLTAIFVCTIVFPILCVVVLG
jgi:hypothetical protein